MNRKRINIAIVESSHVIYEGLANIIMKSKRNCFMYCLSDLSELDDLLNKETIDFVIVNPLLIQNRIQEFIRFKKQYHDIAWVSLVYSYHDELLLKNFNESISILDSVEVIVDKLSSSVAKSQSGLVKEQLSDREIDVLKQLVGGLSNKEIAEELCISVHTVISHRKNIIEKTGIRSLPGLTIFAISQDVVSLEALSQ